MNPFGDQAIDGLMDFSYNSPPTLPPPSSPLEKRRGGGGGGGKRGTRVKLSTDPQSVAARQRRHRISDRFRILKSLVPGGSKMDTVSMLEEAIHYVKFLKTQIWLHQAALMLPPPMDDPCHASPYHAQAAANNNIACGYGSGSGSGSGGSGSSSFGTCQMVVPTQEMVSYSSMQLPPLPCYYHQDEEMMPNLG